MPIRMTGINSGLDTDSIITALVSNIKTKKESYEKKQTKLTWSQEAWKGLNKKVYSLYTNISNLRFSASYSLKKTTSSDATKATVTASNTAVSGSQKLNILQMAQAGYLTGGKISSSATTTTTLAELGYTGGEASINVDKGDGTSSTIKVDSTSTINDVITQLKDAGLNASLDTTNHRLFVSSKNTGVDDDFNLIGADTNGLIALSKLGLSTSLTSGTDDSGNPIYTEAGKTYKKYAAFATDASGNTITDDAVIKNNILNAISAYNSASKTYEDSNKQISNLSAALGYARAYGQTQTFYSDKGITDIERFNNVMSSYSENTTSFVNSAGNVYNATTGVDDKGNTVFRYVDEDKNNHYVSREVLYSDENGNSYRKTSSGEYVSVTNADTKYEGDTSKLTEAGVKYYDVTEKITYENTDADGNKTAYQVTSADKTEQDKNGNEVTKKQYSITVDGKKYVSDSEEGDYKSEDGEIIKITKKYEYTQSAQSSDYTQITDAYNNYLHNNNISDEEASKFKENLTKVKAFESQVTDTEEISENSKLNIMNQVHATASSDMNDLINEYSEKIANLTTTAENAQKTVDENSAVKSIASLSGDKLDKAVNNMVDTAKLAVEQLKNNLDSAGAAVKMNGQNSIIKLNDVIYENTTNGIEVNGITINALAVTGDGDENAITITTNTDTQAIYDKIKDFITQYNEVINEMCKLYNADSSKGYEPLTDGEKEQMSDKEIEKWEEKIKDSLLRHDSTLSSVMSAMTNSMIKGYSINGKNYSLSSFGIQTLGFFNAPENENYAYHIDGDPDDENSSGNTDKLMSMITSDPDTVVSFFQQLTSDLYKTLGDKMQRTSLSSSYTIYNDKQMDKQQTEYKKLIKEWEEKLTEKEDYYYKKFSAMETAMSKLNSTQSSLSGYFGS